MFNGSFKQVINNDEISTSGTHSEYGTELSISKSGKYCNVRCRSFSGKIGGVAHLVSVVAKAKFLLRI